MKFTTKCPDKPGYYLEHSKVAPHEWVNLLQVYEQGGKLRVNISHFGRGYGRTILLSTYREEKCGNDITTWCEVKLPKR